MGLVIDAPSSRITALQKYHPQWVFHKPQGTQEEPFEIPFSFTLPADGNVYRDLPIQIDNEDTRLRGIFFNRLQAQVGTAGAFIGPELVDTNAVDNTGSFFYNRPNVILNGTTRWQFICETVGASWHLKAYVRDNALGTWAEVDAGNGPTVVKLFGGSPGADRFGCPTYLRDPLDSTKVICAYPRSLDSTLAFVIFDMGAPDSVTGSFGAPVTGGPEAFSVDFLFNGPPNTVSNDDTGAKVCVGYRAVDNSLVFHYQSAPEVVTGTTCLRSSFVTYDRTGAAWSVAVQLVTLEHNPYEALGVLVDPNTNISHCIMIRPNNGIGPVPPGATYEIWHCAVESNGTVNAKNLITDTVRQDREPDVGYPVLRPLGATFEIIVPFLQQDLPFVPTQGFYAAVGRATVAIAPAWTVERVSTVISQGPIGDGFVTPCCALDTVTGDPYVFWFQQDLSDPDFHYRMYYSNGTNAGAGWAAPINIYTVPDANDGDYLEFPSVSPLPGIGIAIVAFSSQINNGPFQISYWELRLGSTTTVDAFFLARLRDTFGNPMSQGLTLMLGGWANHWGAGCGFPVDSDVLFQSGGAVLMDVQFSNLNTATPPDPPMVTLSGALLCVRRRRCD